MSAETLSKVTAVLGSQWGDEGKGKLVDVLCQKFDVCARFNGGSNAGHTIVVEGKGKFAFHLLPSGIVGASSKCLIGNGCVVHLPTLFTEMKALEEKGIDFKGRLFISDRAHIVFDFHQTIDGMNETELGGSKIGTTGRGIGPAYIDKANRSGIRIGDLANHEYLKERLGRTLRTIEQRFKISLDLNSEVLRYSEYAKQLQPYIVDGVHWINDQYRQGKSILLEGANAALLDIDFGTYPYVTSSNPTIGGAITGLGLSPNKLGDVIAIVKAYTTRVGGGPFPTEDLGELGQRMRDRGKEYGTTTGRPRRCGWFDAVVVRYSNLINGYTYLNLTKLDILSGFRELKIAVEYKYQGSVLPSIPSSIDVLSKVEVVYETLDGWEEDISKCSKFEELPVNCRKYVERIEQLIGVPIKWIGVGPSRADLIVRN